ncbi:MAG: hypothetical protein ABSF12_12605 [Bryobacteraceae bacterium]
MRNIFAVGVCLLAGCGSLPAVTLFGVCGTGFSGFTGTSCGTEVLPGGNRTDGNFTLISDPTAEGISTPISPFVTSIIGFPIGDGNWLADSLTSLWISPKSTEQSNDSPGTYIYQETFTISAAESPNTAEIVGMWAADNDGTIMLNGITVGTAITGTGGFNHYTGFTITSGFVEGENFLDFVVTNNSSGSPNVTGLRVNITSATISLPEPATFGIAGLGLVALGILGRRLRS